MTTRSRSTTGGRPEGASTDDLPIGTNWRCAIPSANIIRLCLQHPYQIFFPKATTPSTAHATSAMVEKIILKSNRSNSDEGKQNHGRRGGACAKFNRTQSPDEESYTPGLHLRACLPSADSGHMILPYIRSNNSKHNNHIGDTKLRRLVF